jgi:hypothetical protein
MAERRLSGTVEDQVRRRYEDALVRLAPTPKAEQPGPGVKAKIKATDDDGDFDIDLSDETRWPEGDYRLEVFHDELIGLERRQAVMLSAGKIELDPPQKVTAVRLTAIAKNQVSQRSGIIFMAFMFALLGISIWLYLSLHDNDALRSRISASPPVNRDLNAMVATARDQVAPDQVGPGTLVADSLKAAKDIYDALVSSEEGIFDARKQTVISTLFAQAEKANAAKNSAQLKGVLASLDLALREPSDAFFWNHYPGNLLEVVFWALGATLIRLLFNSGNYLRKRCFHKNAIAHHISLIVTAPILAVLIAFVLSLVDINLGLGERAVRIDLSNVAFSILVGAVIGLAPFGAWEFMQDLADALFRNLSKLVSNNDDDASVEEGA